MSSRYGGLLVDYGGVLTSDLFESFRSFCALEGLAPDAVSQAFRRDPAARDLLIGLETGSLTEAEFEPPLADILGVAPAGLINRLFAELRPDTAMLAAVRRAHEQGIRTGLISNSWGAGLYDRDQLVEMFDAMVISGEEGIRKPAPQMYRLGAERIGLDPEACVFVDDLPFNLEPAAELGMATIHHVESEQTVAALEQLLGVELR